MGLPSAKTGFGAAVGSRETQHKRGLTQLKTHKQITGMQETGYSLSCSSLRIFQAGTTTISK
ncbi:hypothetical protein BHF78_08745 [Corynebacterium diphtheriae]|nr:hypothetical protein BHF76_00590 [Corynebacterium diphtheriae]OIR66705.1 hypothetical protein BHF73_09655 [Corynebacterium diphtheriae]OIR66845.1 hypothetical protein BHF77_07755 [Corynebacterium diphtheriae]OIR73779.1 hypothetical protein BHF78_08745 [Corynebacterium diphtheriae]OIR79856.1 hypothetical protein BHF81_07565 [Corynebacterium diphtheriae]